MSTFTITFNPPDLLQRMRNAPAVVLPAMKRALDAEMQHTIAHITEQRLGGQGPYPVSQHRLGRVSHQLAESLDSTRAVISGTTLSASAISTGVKYAAIHEFGGVIEFKPRPGSVRLRLDARGQLVRQADGRGARFARAEHKRARTVTFMTKGHKVTMPARAAIRTGIEDRAPAIAAALGAAAAKALDGGARA